MRRCAAPVLKPQSMGFRADGGTERRCRRNGKIPVDGAFGVRWFCSAHARIWQRHNQIVRRILDIPARVI